MTLPELRRLRDRVLATIRGVDARGALERVRSLAALADPGAPGAAGTVRLADVPALILYAEKEGAVLAASSPTRALLESRLAALFPQGDIRVVTGSRTPVQHASLIFHHPDFLPHVAAFYRGLRTRRLGLAA